MRRTILSGFAHRSEEDRLIAFGFEAFPGSRANEGKKQPGPQSLETQAKSLEGQSKKTPNRDLRRLRQQKHNGEEATEKRLAEEQMDKKLLAMDQAELRQGLTDCGVAELLVAKMREVFQASAIMLKTCTFTLEVSRDAHGREHTAIAVLDEQHKHELAFGFDAKRGTLGSLQLDKKQCKVVSGLFANRQGGR